MVETSFSAPESRRQNRCPVPRSRAGGDRTGDRTGFSPPSIRDHCGVGRLKTADSDGSNVRLVHGSVSSDVGIGSTVFFTVQDEDHDLAAPIAGGKTISLGMHSEFGDPRYASDATGTAFAYRKSGSDHGVADGSLVFVALPSGKSQTLVDGEAEELGNRIWSPRGNWLAFCRGPKGAAKLASLTLVAADGSTRIDVSSNSSCYAFTFSPDDAWLVYPEIDSAGGTRVLTYSLKDRSSVVLGVLPEGYFSLAFSDDSASVVATVDLKTSVVTSPIYAGPAGAAGSLRVLDDTLAFPTGIVSTGGYLAVPTGNWTAAPIGYWTVGVYPVSGGAPVTIPGSGLRVLGAVEEPAALMAPEQRTLVVNEESRSFRGQEPLRVRIADAGGETWPVSRTANYPRSGT